MEDDASLLINKRDDCIDLPPGFRFHPTDEEIISHYLLEKVLNSSFSATAVGEVDLNKCEPWDLPKKAKMGEKEWYFFCLRDRKYPSGMRTNRATEAGYWKATGKDKEIYKGKDCLVGMKKTLVFYTGRAPKGEKTNWVMNEYRLEGKFSHHTLPNTAKEAWVVCKVFHKRTEADNTSPVLLSLSSVNSNSDDQDGLLDSPYSLPPLLDPPRHCNSNGPSSSFMRTEDQMERPNSRTMRASEGRELSYFNDHHKTFLPAKTNNQRIPGYTFPDSTLNPQIDVIAPICGTSDLGYLPQKKSNSVGSLEFSSVPQEAISRTLCAANEAFQKNMVFSVEQPSWNQSGKTDVPQDTVWGTALNTEISSMNSKKHMRRSSSYEDLEEPPSSGPLLDLEFLWN